MAGTVTTDLAFFSAANDSSCDSTGVWSGYTLTLDTEANIQGTGCASFKLNVTTTVSAAVVFTPTSAVDMSSKYMYFWTQGLKIAQWDTKTNGGIRAYFADATNWAEWFVNGKDTMPGGWVPHAARPADIVDAGIESYGATPTLQNQTTECNNNTTNDVNVMCTAGQGTPITGDCFYIGKTMPFKRIIWRVTTALVGTSTVSYEYWNGTAWTALSGVTDRTTNFTVAGVNRVEYTLPTDWVPYTVNSQGPFYYIRAKWTIGTYGTRPICARAWVRFGKDPDRSDVVAATGDTNTNKEVDWGQVTKVGMRVKLLLGATKVNCWFDAFRYGSYIQNTGGSGGSEGSFSDFMTDGTNGEAAQSWGIIEKLNGVYYIQGNIYLGSSGTAATSFKDTDAHVRFKNNDSVGDSVMGIDFLSNSTGTTNIQLGNMTTAGGKNLVSGGLLIDTDGPYYIINITQTKSTDTALIYGTKFKGCSRFRIGTTSTTASYWKLVGNKLEACNTIIINDGGSSTFDQNTIASALVTPSLNAVELYAVTSTCTWTDNVFINNSTASQRAIVFMSSGTYIMTRNTFANNTIDLYFNHSSGTVTANVIDSTDNPVLGPSSSTSISYDVYEKTTWDLNVQNSSAANINDVGVRITDTAGTEQVLVRTNSDGDIVQQQVKRRTSEHSSGLPKGAATVTVHNPYELRVRKYAYLPTTIAGKTFSTTAIVDSMVLSTDPYAVTAETTVDDWANITMDRTWTRTRTTLTSAQYGTLAFAAAAKTITRTSGDWTDTSPETDNYSVKGTKITITNSTSNNATFTVVSATALVLTVLETPVDEIASSAETVNGIRPYLLKLGSAAPNRSINDVYEFMRWLTSQTTTPANYMNVLDPIQSADGVTYVVTDYNFDVDTITLTGTGKTLYMPDRDFTLTSGGGHGLSKVQDIDGSSVSITVICLDINNDPIENVRASVYKISDDTELLNTLTDINGTASAAYTYLADTDVVIHARKNSPGDTRYINESTVQTITANGLTVQILMRIDPVA